jgi:DNA-binding MarR family transcriptional regulator
LINFRARLPYRGRVTAGAGSGRAARGPDARPTPGSVGEIELQLAVLVRQAVGARRAAAAAERLERSAYLLLSILTDRGATSVNVLADRLGLNASTITRQVDAMARDGLVSRVKHPTDGRVTLVVATDRGARDFAADRSARHTFFTTVTAAWPPADRVALAALLTRLNEDIDAVARSAVTGSDGDRADEVTAP